jgi:predicted RNA-binding Zn-ribbon protein involved in translation (DUF1610 family)
MEKLIKVASFNELAPAEAVAERLKGNGIEALVHDESNQQQWQLWNLAPRAHLQVKVGGPHEERAVALIKEWIAEGGAAASAVRCPECGSLRIEYPQFSRKTILGALPAAFAAAGVIERNYYCESCHFTWPSESPKAGPELDILNWPKK